MEAPKSTFGFSQFVILKSSIEQKLDVDQGSEFTIFIEPEARFFEDQNLFELQLEVKVSDELNRFDVQMTALGYFPTENLAHDDSFFDYLCINAPALMFPYIRAFVSTITAQSGLEAVMLPPMNLQGIGGKIKNSLKTLKV